MGIKKEAKKTIRKLVQERDGHMCKVCGCPHSLQVHHIVHKAKGGFDSMDNLVTLCSDCHMIVHTKLKSLIKSGMSVVKFQYLILLIKNGDYLNEPKSNQ